MSIATIVYDLMEDGDKVPGQRFGDVADNFLIVFVDDEGVLRRHRSGPGPWDEVIEAMGDKVNPGEGLLAWTRPIAEVEVESD